MPGVGVGPGTVGAAGGVPAEEEGVAQPPAPAVVCLRIQLKLDVTLAG